MQTTKHTKTRKRTNKSCSLASNSQGTKWTWRCRYSCAARPPGKKHPKQLPGLGSSQATMYQSIPKLPICNLHISHNTPCLPPKTLHNLCFKFLLGITVALREIRQIAYAKLWGENKVYMYYGRYANGKFLPLWKLRASQFLKNFGQISILCWPFRWSNAPPINTSKSLTHQPCVKPFNWSQAHLQVDFFTLFMVISSLCEVNYNLLTGASPLALAKSMYYIIWHDISVVVMDSIWMSIFDITLAKEGFENKLRWLSCLFLFVG